MKVGTRVESTLRTVTVTFNSGFAFTTSVSGTVDEIVDYYINNKFNTAHFPNERMETPRTIEFIDKEI